MGGSLPSPICSLFAGEEIGVPREGLGDWVVWWDGGSVTLLSAGGPELGASWTALRGGLGL